MDEAEERKAWPVQKRANAQGWYMHWEDRKLWLTLISDTPMGLAPRRNERSSKPFSSIEEVDQWLREQVAPE
jgi:hypothetical protein